MLPEDQPVEYILEGIDAEMGSQAQPKVILFDIGGVVVSDGDGKGQQYRVLSLVHPMSYVLRSSVRNIKKSRAC